jgi:pSer/pThr/pTyr-binding forkhead associated (FHA) protein
LPYVAPVIDDAAQPELGQSSAEVSDERDADDMFFQRTSCVVCGAYSQPCHPCPNCGEPTPGVSLPATGTSRASSKQIAKLHLPNGDSLVLPPGVEISIGKESLVPQVAAALRQFESVSRRHCLITVDPARRRVVIRDPGSTNRTYIGDDTANPVGSTGQVVQLPAKIRLGKFTAVLTITLEEE